MPTIDEYAISLPDGASIPVQAVEDFWQAIDDIALLPLSLPDRRLKKRLRI
jgi:hypothetical protein